MTLALLMQTFINGLVIGMNYVLIASGFTLIYGVMRLLNFAHGELYMLGSLVLYYVMTKFELNYFASFIVSIAVVGLLGVLLERVFFRPFRVMHDVSLIIALGLALLISGSAFLISGPEDKGVPSVFTGTLRLGSLSLSLERLSVIAISALITTGLWLFLSKVRTGMAMRAIAQDSEAAALQGVNIDHISSIGFGLSSALAAAAGALMVPMYYVNPFIGATVIFKALVVVIIGGLGSVPGAAVAGLLLGMVESFGYTFIGEVAELLGFIFVLVFLIFRPRGLMGRY